MFSKTNDGLSSKVSVAERVIEHSKQSMPSVMIIWFLRKKLELCHLLNARVAEIHIISKVGFTSTSHADVSGFGGTSQTAVVASEGMAHALHFRLWLPVSSKSFHVNHPVLEYQHWILQKAVSQQSLHRSAILLLGTLNTPVHLRREEVVIGEYKEPLAVLALITFRDDNCIDIPLTDDRFTTAKWL